MKKKSSSPSLTLSYFLLVWNQFEYFSDEYERAVATVNQLTQQIEDLKEATRDDSETVDTLKRKLETSLRDNDRMSKQNKDLGKIIDFILFSIWSIKILWFHNALWNLGSFKLIWWWFHNVMNCLDIFKVIGYVMQYMKTISYF